MNDTPIVGTADHNPAWRGRGEASRWPCSLTALPKMIAIWRQRIYFRRELEEMAKANPHLIDDIGMKKWQVEAEIAKPFWQR
ncbi:DUF1127 domain-containing protein [Labrys sp. LIt4]|uniref:DUF1127 domain-containing protein n=1 Tax=Labrys sp. LIt4 TaxID=2821355 RepID=UPI001AE011B4|nr:DUF1127 domain-containing protein [Labrys sp. LIt4]MBP0582007.1 DUF1127 domain-containing protein [Labrys sp. LIt4]